MKKILIYILVIVAILLIIIAAGIINNNEKVQAVKKFNAEYEELLNKEIYGADVATVINKAVNNNLKNGVEQDEEKNFILNDTNSLEVEIQFLYDEQTGEKRIFSMEKVYYRGMQEFIQNFNLIKFKLTGIEYHQQNKRVSKLVFTQLEA